ncbi:MAG: hypothetical protein HYW07_08895 [Candidatus Latescibacteria bacterium]|nr:hypothetical protein [Candidatus Latescibacterota bacterium]
MRPVILLLVLAAVVATGKPAFGESYSLTFNKSSDRLSWQPNLPSMNWAFPVALSSGQDSMSISLSTTLKYDLDQRDGLNAWQDNASVSSSIHYPILGRRASIGIQASASSRSATLQKQKIRSQSYGFRFQYNPFQSGPFRSLSTSVTPGAITARRASRAKIDSTIQEKGVQYNAALRVSPDLKVGGEKLNSSLSVSKRDNTLKNNKDRNESLSMSLGYSFPHQLRTNFSFSQNRSEQGVTRAKISETVAEELVRRDTAVVAELSQNEGTNFSSDLSFKLSRFDFNSRVGFNESRNTNTANADADPRNQFFAKDHENQSRNFSTSLSGKLLDQLTSSASFKYDTADQRRLEVELPDGETFRDSTNDRESSGMSLSGRLGWQLSENHSLELSSQASSGRADNPGAAEQNRDTFGSNARLKYSGKFASDFNLDAELTNTYSHKVNLDARSASDNSRNKDLKLSIGTRYERLGASFTHDFDISARRTVFDFDRLLYSRAENRKSNIRRGWGMTHGVQRRFFGALQLSGRYAYNAEDFGLLVVEDQSQLVKEEDADHTLSSGLSYSLAKALSLGANYSYRLDRQWTYDYRQGQEERALNRCIRNSTLGVNLNYNSRSEEANSAEATSISLGVSRAHQENCNASAAKSTARDFDSFKIALKKTL